MADRKWTDSKGAAIRRVARRHGAGRLRFFGSQASGRAANHSDLDLLVELAPDRDLPDLIGRIEAYTGGGIGQSRLCMYFLRKRIETQRNPLGILRTDKVDIVILNRAPCHLAYIIVAVGVLLLDRDPRFRTGFEASCTGRFLDLKPFLQLAIQVVLDIANHIVVDGLENQHSVRRLRASAG